MSSRDKLKDVIKSYDFKNLENINKFKEIMDDLVEQWNPFNVVWKDTIQYPISNRKNLSSLKIGKHFKENGILNFIVGGFRFGFCQDRYVSYNQTHGIMLLDVEGEEIYCYYYIDMGGCPTCQLGLEPGNPYITKFYMSDNLINIVDYCMSTEDVKMTIDYFKYHLLI